LTSLTSSKVKFECHSSHQQDFEKLRKPLTALDLAINSELFEFVVATNKFGIFIERELLSAIETYKE
jgi:hypothetical protein